MKCPEKTCLENYLGEAVRRINERVRIRSHTLQHTLQFGHPSVSLNEVEIKNFLKLYDPFLWMGFNCLKATEPLRGDSLLFTTKFPAIPGTHLIDLERMKD